MTKGLENQWGITELQRSTFILGNWHCERKKPNIYTVYMYATDADTGCWATQWLGQITVEGQHSSHILGLPKTLSPTQTMTCYKSHDEISY